MLNREKAIKELLVRNVEEIVDRKHLEQALKSGKTLRVKLGIDPTSPDLHLGHAVVLRKLREFQELGHVIVLIIGDFTGRIGDPSGRSDARKPLTESQINDNMKEYLIQAGKIIDVERAEIFHNSSWILKGGVSKIIELANAASIQQVLHRADFKKRLDAGQDVTLLEVFYPVFQGYDSVAVNADIELGGTDQTFNLLMGRRIQRHFGMEEQDILTVPLLEGTDGVKKMSKSVGNYIGLYEESDQMFGKIMSLPDKLMERYFELATELEPAEFKKLAQTLSPRDLKVRLGMEIVKLYHGEGAADAAKEKFEKVFSKRKPEDTTLPEFIVKTRKLSILDLILSPQGAKRPNLKSKSEALRLINEGAIAINGQVKKDRWEIIELRGGEILKIGKRGFFRVK